MLKKTILCLMMLSVFVLTGCSRHNETSEDNDTLTQIKKRGELIVGVKYDSKPFGFIKDGKLQGYDIDIAHLMAKRILGNEKLIKFVEVDAQNRISKLRMQEYRLEEIENNIINGKNIINSIMNNGKKIKNNRNKHHIFFTSFNY